MLNSSQLKLYLVTDADLLKDRDFYTCIENALKGGVTAIQLRDKNCTDSDFLVQAKHIQSLASKYNALFFINDRVHIATQLKTDGVHVGQSDLNAIQIKQTASHPLLIGVSATTVSEAIKAELDGADYIGVGAMFQTNTKTDASYVTLDTLKEILKHVSIPVVLIGGLSLSNISTFKNLPIAGYALVSAILNADDITRECHDWLSLISENHSHYNN
ncbi:MAG: thiamine phosphate synthase [Cellulosilyticaceae bacterium]